MTEYTLMSCQNELCINIVDGHTQHVYGTVDPELVRVEESWSNGPGIPPGHYLAITHRALLVDRGIIHG